MQMSDAALLPVLDDLLFAYEILWNARACGIMDGDVRVYATVDQVHRYSKRVDLSTRLAVCGHTLVHLVHLTSAGRLP